MLEELRDGALGAAPKPQAGPPPEPTEFTEDLAAPPVGDRPFPSGTRCDGEEIAFVSPTSVAPVVTKLELTGARAGSTVCFRKDQEDRWETLRADADGAVAVPLAGRNAVHEILVEQDGGVWKKVVVTTAEEPPGRSKLPLYLVLAAVLVIGVGALLLNRARCSASTVS